METGAGTLPLGKGDLNTGDVECTVESEVLVKDGGVSRKWAGVGTGCVLA